MAASNFIGGEFCPAQDGAVFNLSDAMVFESPIDVPDSGLLDVVRAIQAANKALPNWLKSTLQDRATLLNSIAVTMETRSAEIARAQFADIGTPPDTVVSSSVVRAVRQMRHHAQLITHLDLSSSVQRQPIGLVGLITPIVDPFAILSARTSAALAAGNALVCKSSEYTPRTAQIFCEILRDSGLPAGVFNVVQGRGEVVGQALCQHPGVSTISFTGSTDVGREVAKAASDGLKKTHLAMSAKNPILVFAGVDLAKAADCVAQIGFGSHPMSCLRGSRLFIQETIYKEFLAALERAVEKIPPPAGLPRISFQSRFAGAIGEALREKGKRLFGSDSALKPAATLIFDLNQCSTLQQDEVPGPFVTASSFKYQYEAIKQANTSPYGLAAYVYASEAEKSAAVSSKLEYGRIYVNAAEPSDDPRMAIGGLKLSGPFRENGDEMLKFFSRETTVLNSVS